MVQLGALRSALSRWANAILVTSSLVSCAASLPADLSETIEVRIVEGLQPHSPVDEDTFLSVFHGLQGGFHVFLALEVANLEPGAATLLDGLSHQDLPTLTITMRTPDGLINVASPQQSVAEPINEGWRIGPELVVLRYYEELPIEGFNPVEREAELESFVVDIVAHVEDARGATGTASAQARLVFEPYEPGIGGIGRSTDLRDLPAIH